MVPLAAETEARLREVGWFPNRRWGRLKVARSHIERHGHRLSAAAIEFLSEFGVGLPVSIVGQASNGYTSVLVADDGRVFLAMDDDPFCIGDDRYDALNSLCIGPDYNVERARRHLSRGGTNT